MAAELKCGYLWKKNDVAVARAPNGDTVVELRKDPGGTILQTKSHAWRRAGAGLIDATGATVATFELKHFRGYDVTLAGGELIEMRDYKLRGNGCSFRGLAEAKAPFLFPQRSFTLTLSDALMAREDRELLIAAFTYLAESSISTQIMVSSTS